MKGIACFTLAIFISYSTIPIIDKIGRNFGLLDRSDLNEIDIRKIVRVGGISIFIGLNLSLLFIFLLNKYYFYLNFDIFKNLSNLLPFYIISTTGFFLIGLIDDLLNLSPFSRLFFQFLISIFFWKYGLRIEDLFFLDEFISEENIFLANLSSLIITSIWIVGVTNAINWFDGLDGLAAGFSFITSLGFVFVSFLNKNYDVGFLSLCFSGSCLGFLKRNFYPASILMGDSGSYFLGIQLSCLSLIITQFNFQDIQYFRVSNFNILIAFLFLFLPLLDMIYVISLRLCKGKSPFFGDKSHFHHRLLSSGYSHKLVVFIILSITVITTIIATLLSLNF